MNRTAFFLLLAFSLLGPLSQGMAAPKEFKVSVGDLANKGHLDFANSMAEIYKQLYPGKQMTIGVYPLARSIQNVISGEADVHMPLLRSDAGSEKNLKFTYSSQSYTQVVVVIYSNKANPLTRKTLETATFSLPQVNLKKKFEASLVQELLPLFDKTFSTKEALTEALQKHLSAENFAKHSTEIIKFAYPFNVGTPIVGNEVLDLPISTQTSIEGAMKMVDSGRLDAFIMTQGEGDQLMRSLKLKNTYRSLYAILPVHFILAKNKRGKRADEILTKILAEMKKRGVSKKLSSSIHKINEYDDWQAP